MLLTEEFTFSHLADALIQSNLRTIEAIKTNKRARHYTPRNPVNWLLYSLIHNHQLGGLKSCLTTQKAKEGSSLQRFLIEAFSLCSGVSHHCHSIADSESKGFLCGRYKLAWQIFSILDMSLLWQQLHHNQTLTCRASCLDNFPINPSYALNRTSEVVGTMCKKNFWKLSQYIIGSINSVGR